MFFRKMICLLGLVGVADAAVAQQPWLPATASAGIEIGDLVVTLDHCVLQLGTAYTDLPGGKQLRVVDLLGDWVGCAALIDGREHRGWIKYWLLAKVGSGFPAADFHHGDTVVTLQDTLMKLGDLVLGTVPRGARLQVLATSGEWVGVYWFGDAGRQEGWVKRHAVAAAGGLPAYAAAPATFNDGVLPYRVVRPVYPEGLPILPAQTPSVYGLSIVTFDNQSSDPALVRLVGPTRSEIFVPRGGRNTIYHVARGSYVIYVRYGYSGSYRYSRGDRFSVEESGPLYSTITVLLHVVQGGNYTLHNVDEDEFNQALR
jgi:hypothetical protein